MSTSRSPSPSSITWILVADRGRARLLTFPYPDGRKLVELRSWIHPEGASRAQECEADRPGEFHGRGHSRSFGDPETDFVHKTADQFACQLAQELDRARQRQEFGQLVIIAAPVFLGSLRSHLSGPLKKIITSEIDKEMTLRSPQEILSLLRETNALEQTTPSHGSI